LNRIVIVTSGQPAGNPRMTKEAIALQQAGYLVTVIFCPMSPWGDSFDNQLFKKYPKINWICVGAHPNENPIKYLFVRIRKKFWDKFYLIFGNRFHSALKSSVLFSQELFKETKKHKADLYIGHNLGAIYAVVKVAQDNLAKACFDFEDFHRGEDQLESRHFKKIKIIEDQFVNQLNFAYTASHLITQTYSQLYPNLSFETINNCFPLKYQSTKKIEFETPIKLFWFSQFIGKKRGIEQIIEAIGLLKDYEVNLTLLGNINETDKDYFKSIIAQNEIAEPNIIFIDAVEEKKVFEIASEHHIGFASETGKDFNNNIALSNKIFTYLLAGNAILFSDTDAQRLFFKSNSNIGFLYSQGNSKELANFIMKYILEPELLINHRNNSFNASKNWNWENESRKLISLVKQQLH
jgi:hypothetical protein